MKMLLRAVTMLIVLCGALVAVLLYERATPQRGETTAAAEGQTAADQLGKFTPLASKLPAPAVSFAAQNGENRTLADFRGHPVLVNLWATWCAPCVAEMPSLDRLQATLGNDLAILAVSEDRNGAAVVDPFLAKLHLGQLQIFLDPKNGLSNAFQVRGLPTSILIDRDGNVIGKLEGAAQWDSAEMVALIRREIGPPGERAATR
jgi:thiol-disulfide isomerase/thioredoxin